MCDSCFLFFPACICATDFPTVRVFWEPLIPARPWPSQQDLQHLTTPHDCHHLCVTVTAGNHPRDGCSCWWASGNQRNKRIFVFSSWTQWECVGRTLSTFCFFSPSVFFSFVTLVFLSFSNELRDGPNQNQSYSTISLLYFYLLEFNFNVRRCSEEKSGCLMNKNEWLSGWPFFSSVFYWLSFVSSRERIM